jgi:hypothetical protein
MTYRGFDSYGILHTNPALDEFSFTLEKRVGKLHPKGLGLIDPWSGDALIHTRQATTGSVTTRNAHPFVRRWGDQRVVWAHNGVVWNHDALERQDGATYLVDSEVFGVRLAMRDTMDDVSCYGALAWFDSTAKPRYHVAKVSSSGDLDMVQIAFQSGAWAVLWASHLRGLHAKHLDLSRMRVAEYRTDAHKVYALHRGMRSVVSGWELRPSHGWTGKGAWNARQWWDEQLDEGGLPAVVPAEKPPGDLGTLFGKGLDPDELITTTVFDARGRKCLTQRTRGEIIKEITAAYCGGSDALSARGYR